MVSWVRCLGVISSVGCLVLLPKERVSLSIALPSFAISDIKIPDRLFRLSHGQVPRVVFPSRGGR